MKKIYIIFLMLTGSVISYGQSANGSEELKFYTEALELDEAQQLKLEQILLRKSTDIQRLEANNNYPEPVFREKRRNIYKGTEKSIRIMLKESQLDKWTAYQNRKRVENAEKIRELRASGASVEDIKDAQFGIY